MKLHRFDEATHLAKQVSLSEDQGVRVAGLNGMIAIESERFSARFPSDPADRLIAATARVHDLTLLTQDRGLRASREVKTLW